MAYFTKMKSIFKKQIDGTDAISINVAASELLAWYRFAQ